MTDKIRVLFAIGEMSGGGSQRQLIGILKRLDRSRFKPCLYVVSAGGELLPEVPADVPVEVFVQRCPRVAAWFPGQAHRARVRDLAAVLKERQIDVIYDRTYHMTLIAAAAARRTPAKRISVIVTDPARDFAGNVERFRSVKRWLLQRAYHAADRVVAVSEGVREAAEAYYNLPPGKTLTIYNGFDIDRIDKLMVDPLPPLEVKSPGRFEIVAAGRLHLQKGFLHLLEAIHTVVHNRGLKQVHLRILGAGPLLHELQAFIAQHQLTSHVTLAGFRANPLPYFRQADLFCLSSLYEGMPNALVEAMLCQTPVLATDCPSGPREILLDGRFGQLVPPADSRALARAIETCAKDSAQPGTSLAAARMHIIQTFSPDLLIRRLEELLVQTVGK